MPTTNRYELHITVDKRHLADTLRSYGVAGKVLDIVLDSGEYPQQLMVGINIQAPNFLAAYKCVLEQHQQIKERFEVRRLKIEADPNNDADRANDFFRDPPPLYYEAHWKVKKGTPMRAECFRLPVYHSFNREQEDIEYWTIRSNAFTKKVTFDATYKTITEYLEGKGKLIKPPHKEIALVDTNLKLDAGWRSAHG